MQKPLNLLTSGIAIVVLSCVILLSLLFRLCREVYAKQTLCLSEFGSCIYKWHLDESFVWAAVLVHVVSLSSSSMVEEEQYIWHFLTSTLFFIFLRTTIQFLPAGPMLTSSNVTNVQKSGTVNCSCMTRFGDNASLQWKNRDRYFQICSIILVLICGRILRGWHQGGVNWTNLPDISKFLEDAGAISIKLLQIASVLLIITFGSFAIYLVKSTRILVTVVQVSICSSGLLVILYILECQSNKIMVTNYSAASVAQLIFAMLGITVMGTALASPWIMPVRNWKACKDSEPNSTVLYGGMEFESLVSGVRDSAYLIGMTYVVCWCLLQLLLQQPINAAPILLLLLQILFIMICFSTEKYLHKQWVEVGFEILFLFRS